MSPAAMPSPITAEANVFVADRRDGAEALGRRLADEVNDPTAFADVLRSGLEDLSDPAYLEGQRRIAPGIGALHGVRWPLIEAVKRGFRQETRRDPTSGWLVVADRLLREETLEEHWFAFGLLERLVVDDTERAWQLLRRASQQAADWITVDSLAHPVGKGILLEPYRWAELEQLTVSPSRWERRLVGSTIATMPYVNRTAGRTPDVAAHGLALLGTLIGDRESDVQKALSWGYRSMAIVEPSQTAAALDHEAARAAAQRDGHRAWVVRDSLSKLDRPTADAIRARLEGVRRRPAAPSTSDAAELSERFAAMGLGRPMPEPPLT